MSERGHEDLLQSDLDALVNSVNAAKGIALQFKEAFAETFGPYE